MEIGISLHLGNRDENPFDTKEGLKNCFPKTNFES